MNPVVGGPCEVAAANSATGGKSSAQPGAVRRRARQERSVADFVKGHEGRDKAEEHDPVKRKTEGEHSKYNDVTNKTNFEKLRAQVLKSKFLILHIEF